MKFYEINFVMSDVMSTSLVAAVAPRTKSWRHIFSYIWHLNCTSRNFCQLWCII